MAKGYSHKEGIDYEEVFAPVARMETIRVFIAVGTQRGWPIHQLDFKSAFLNGELKEEVYVTQPEGFIVEGNELHVYRLHKALYGLLQAPEHGTVGPTSILLNWGLNEARMNPLCTQKFKKMLAYSFFVFK